MHTFNRLGVGGSFRGLYPVHVLTLFIDSFVILSSMRLCFVASVNPRQEEKICITASSPECGIDHSNGVSFLVVLLELLGRGSHTLVRCSVHSGRPSFFVWSYGVV